MNANCARVSNSRLLGFFLYTLLLSLGASWGPKSARAAENSFTSRQTLVAAKKATKKRKPTQKNAPKASEPEIVATPPPVVEPSLPPPPALPKKDVAVAIVSMQGIDVEDDLVRNIEQALLNEVDELPKHRAISSEDVRRELEQFGLSAASCQNDITCLARAGRYARAHLGIEARVASLGGTLNISMRLIDTEARTEITRVADPLSDDSALRIQELHRLAIQLLAPETYVGSLMIRCAVEGAELYLDDKLVGTTPLNRPLRDLRAGPHILRVSKPGFADLNQFVDVVYKRASTITVDLNTNTVVGSIVEVESKTGFGSLYVVYPDNAIEIRIDGEPKGRSNELIEKIAAGGRRISFRRDGNPQATIKEVEIRAGQRLDIFLKFDNNELSVASTNTVSEGSALPNGTTLAANASSQKVKSWNPSLRFYSGIVAAGVGLGALGASAYFGKKLQDDNKAAERINKQWQETGRFSPNSAESLKLRRQADKVNESGARHQTLNRVFLGAGGALLAAGFGLIVWDAISF